MGTTGCVTIKNEDGKILCNLYTHYDGDVFGAVVAEFMDTRKFSKGIPLHSSHEVFNGIGDFAALLVTHVKNKIENQAGCYYLLTNDERDLYNVDYEYEIKVVNKKVKLYFWYK